MQLRYELNIYTKLELRSARSFFQTVSDSASYNRVKHNKYAGTIPNGKFVESLTIFVLQA
jgi:hypothetical protein